MFWQVISNFENTIVSTDPLRETIKIMTKLLILEILILLFLKHGGEWILKFNNNGNNSYEIKPKTYKMKDLVALSWR